MTAGNTLLSVWGPGTEKNAEKASVTKAVFEFLQWTCHKYAEDYCHPAVVDVLLIATSWTSSSVKIYNTGY